MSRNPNYQFVSTDTDTIVTALVAAYEKITGSSVKPASPEKLFIQWVANIVIQERTINNYTGNQNIPSRAEGMNLDALGELFYGSTRPKAQSATCTGRFYISAVQTTAILIPVGTRVTDASNTLIWETTKDAYVKIGSICADVPIRCQTAGTAGNGYTIGQINTIVDVFRYYDHCENTAVSDGGANAATDDEYFELMRASMDGYSDAGSVGGYTYFAKQVSTGIADVVANSPSGGQVNLYILMDDGTIASKVIKDAVLASCSASTVRPLTDHVVSADPESVSYNISFTYYIPRNTTMSASEIEAAVNAAVNEYTVWQAGKLGRDINPDKMRYFLSRTGIKRIELVSPSFVALRDGSDNKAPQIAVVGTTRITNGGFEDE